MDQIEFEQKFGHIGRKNQQGSSKTKLDSGKLKQLASSRQCCSKQSLKSSILHLLPILGWLPRYKIGQNFNCDLITGLTVGIMVIPQGMAYATLAKLAPVYGLYSCFFAAFFYMFFGTSPHISIGTFAVASMMVGNVITEMVPADAVAAASKEMMNTTVHNGSAVSPVDIVNSSPLTPIVVASALTFGVGLCQLLMALCRLSFLTNYISDPLVSGFTTGAAIHVFTSQIDKLIGVKIKSYNGPGLIIFMWRDLIMSASNANLWTLGISAFGLVFLSIGRDHVNPWFRRKFRIPFPLELFLVVAAIIFSSTLHFKQNYGVRIVDNVPRGMPVPSLPRADLLPRLWLNAFTISIISYIFAFSLTKIFAKRHKYKVDPNQELYAIGLCSVLSSFFPVYPFGASLSRSSLCEMTGAKTQLHALFSSALLLVVILWIGPLLEPLPMAILGCIVVISLKPLFLQFRELARLWRISFYDFAIWLVAFTATALLDITYGLAISVFFSIFTVVLKEQWPKFNAMGEAKEGIFRPLNQYNDLIDPKSAHPNAQVWRFESPLHFANAPKLVESMAELCQQMAASASPRDSMIIKVLSSSSKEFGGAFEAAEQKKEAKLHNHQKRVCGNCCCPTTGSSSSTSPCCSPLNQPLLASANTTGNDGCDGGSGREKEPTKHSEQNNVGGAASSPSTDHLNRESSSSSSSSSSSAPIGTIVLDCSAVAHIDSVGVDALVEMHKDAQKNNVLLKFAAFPDALLAVFHRCALFQQIPEQHFFPSIRDALAAPNVADDANTARNGV